MKLQQLPLLLILAQPLLADAAIYQWVDENGVTIYSQTPPKSGDARQIPHKSRPTDSTAQQKLRDMQQSIADRQEDRTQQKEKRAEKKKTSIRKRSNCKAATDNLATLTSLGHRRYGGERLTEEQRQEKIAQAKKHIQENCSK
ncbi:MAG: DUF4124 domain-containing protein [Candidatus Polarisedimenticolaceae bacterium]|nr:DUF4124 domain-containing protein [Candidatus Polarisedimenticolaceae bacterium]